MLATLLEILRWNLPSPEIMLDEEGCIELDWFPNTSVIIEPDGKISWSILHGGHGTDIVALKKAMGVET